MIEKRTETEKIILEAAEAEFLEKGYGKSRTTEIAKRAGVNHAMLHYYFRTKENLFAVVFQRKAELMSDVLFLTFKEDLPFFERVRKGVEEHFDFIKLNRRVPNFIFNEILHDEKLKNLFINVLKAKVTSVLESLQQVINDEVEKGTIRHTNAYDLIYNIVALNVFAFLSMPIISGIMDMDDKQYSKFLEDRKQLNVEIILNQLKV